MTRIVHISDLHCGRQGFLPKKLSAAIKEINSLKPDVVVITGDLTISGYRENYEEAKKHISKIKAQKLIIPGNHDTRLCGYEYFDEFFGYGNRTIDLDGTSIIGVDTTIPDLDEGNLGRGKLRWLREELKKRPEKSKRIIAMHHHLIPIPGTGRERSTVTDAGDVLKELIKAGVDLVLCGHKHTPNTWMINGLLIANAGSVSAVKLRANVSNSYNIINIDNGQIQIMLKEMGKKPVEIVSVSKE